MTTLNLILAILWETFRHPCVPSVIHVRDGRVRAR